MLRSFLDISSGHLTPDTWAWLDAALNHRRENLLRDIYGGITIYGWFVYAPEGPDEDLPADLVCILSLARREGAEYVLFDWCAVVALPL
jgi:hypothetical protein